MVPKKKKEKKKKKEHDDCVRSKGKDKVAKRKKKGELTARRGIGIRKRNSLL